MKASEAALALTPPATIWNHSGSFMRSGMQSLQLLVERADIKPHEEVLDVGCGPGRLAFALARYLNDDGGYYGFDPRREAVEWSQTELSKHYPRFRFDIQHIDVYNGAYNPTGSIDPSSLRFPYPDASMDLVVLFSVFTHLLPSDARHYLTECLRVLRPAGRVLASWLIVEKAGTRRAAGVDFNFSEAEAGYFAVNASLPEQAIAFREEMVRDLYANVGLAVADPIMYGRPEDLHRMMDQDIVIARPQ